MPIFFNTIYNTSCSRVSVSNAKKNKTTIDLTLPVRLVFTIHRARDIGPAVYVTKGYDVTPPSKAVVWWCFAESTVSFL